MKAEIQAVIFDMDGVLINSEPLWRKAMIRVFARYGMPVTEDQCRLTMGMRFREVISLWQRHFNKPEHLLEEIDNATLDELIGLINTEGRALDGVYDCLEICRQAGLRTGLATSSSERLMHAILSRLDITTFFQALCSAEKLRYGKPHPEVFLRCAEELQVKPQSCLVIEDSLNGVVAAKAASMLVIAVPDDENLKADERRVKQFTLADHTASNMKEAGQIMRSLIPNAMRADQR